MLKRLSLFLIILVTLSACGKKPAKPQTPASSKAKEPASELRIWGLNRIRASGLENTLFKDFSTQNNCRIELRLFDNVAMMLDTLRAAQTALMPDLVMSLDNSFTLDEELRALFSPIEIGQTQLSRDLMIDLQKRLIPYGYANLGLVYNTKIFAQGPQSFGELQDAKYFRQIGICDPKTSGEGRGALFWSLALFGSKGYEYLWKSIRKNVQEVYPSYESGLEALKSGKIGMLLGYNTSPAWLEESQQTDKSFHFSMLKEGSWQFCESVGIPLAASRPALAARFVQALLDPEGQLMVIYKLGLFPANSKTMLPMRFARIPISSFVVNRRVTEAQITESLPSWLEFWDQLFNNRYPLYD